MRYIFHDLNDTYLSTDSSATDDDAGAVTVRERDLRIENSIPHPTPAILQAARRATGTALYSTLLYSTLLH
jgi:hypothetical protein